MSFEQKFQHNSIKINRNFFGEIKVKSSEIDIYFKNKKEELYMRYAIISNKDTNTSFEIFRSKNIASENVVHINFLPNLMRSLHVGDEVLVISSDRFNTVRQLSCFGKYCMENKVIFSVLAQNAIF